MKTDGLSVPDIARGYTYDAAAQAYCCISCGQKFYEGEVYSQEGRFFQAERAVRRHMDHEHSDYLERLIHSGSKYNALTENQRQLCQLFAAGMADKEIAGELGISTSTVRHQKFIFREKAKQARFYLAVYQRIFEDGAEEVNAIVPIHENARMVDERYVVTEQEREHILHTFFLSLSPLKLKEFSPKEKKKIVILTRIAEEFQRDREYSEKEVNQILSPIFDDFATLRRYLIQYGFMKRTKDCAKYWLA